MEQERRKRGMTMDAVKFLQERDRMCNGRGCNECPIGQTLDKGCNFLGEDIEKIVEMVENWSRKNSEALGKKYIIEIDETSCDGSAFRIKGLPYWLDKKDLAKLKKYKESEE